MIHREIERDEATVRVVCPTCSGDGTFVNGNECRTCDGFGKVDQETADEAPIDGREHFREDRRWARDRDEW